MGLTFSVKDRPCNSKSLHKFSISAGTNPCVNIAKVFTNSCRNFSSIEKPNKRYLNEGFCFETGELGALEYHIP